jgi:hypothetical protein
VIGLPKVDPRTFDHIAAGVVDLSRDVQRKSSIARLAQSGSVRRVFFEERAEYFRRRGLERFLLALLPEREQLCCGHRHARHQPAPNDALLQHFATCLHR